MANRSEAAKKAAETRRRKRAEAEAAEVIPGTTLKAADFADYDPEVVRRVFDAEAAAQLAKIADIAPGEERPEALQDAVAARVKANLAETGGHPVQALGGRDAEVMRLEAPFKLRGVSSDPTPEE